MRIGDYWLEYLSTLWASNPAGPGACLILGIFGSIWNGVETHGTPAEE